MSEFNSTWDPQDGGVVLPPQTIQASLLVKIDNTAYAGRYNFVLLQRDVVDSSDGLGDYGIRGKSFCDFFMTLLNIINV